MSSEHFAQLIVAHRDENKCSYMESIIAVCEDNDFDPADVAGLIPQYIRDAMEPELRGVHMLKPTDVIDIVSKFGGNNGE